MLKTYTAITVAAVAREDGVSRTFLYEHEETKTLVEQAVLKASGRRIKTATPRESRSTRYGRSGP